eukprot:CAMPEP_0197636168 /NCGR_PEP_ID=MMETSP1338-20131121/11765_1 /TAXON_ID=43686 ORGANISM="Pelagodinium beii, Strain RCC1491" /NCGR_SAMPLE_ID=MMETSP1338 /ASSEMBLY_ACC=CAM_ASM_000754 /LENGTH=33 /DNA_ID= /DNA_START= /DNA_END= /DNA_ORIENTATION=
MIRALSSMTRPEGSVFLTATEAEAVENGWLEEA